MRNKSMLMILGVVALAGCRQREAREEAPKPEAREEMREEPARELTTVQGEVKSVDLDSRQFTLDVPMGEDVTLKLSDTELGAGNLEQMLREGAEVRASYDPRTNIAHKLELVEQGPAGKMREDIEEELPKEE